MSIPPASSQAERRNQLFQEQRLQQCSHTDRIFAVLMGLQWIGGMIAAIVISPRTWIGDTSWVHQHVWFAVFFGALISSLPIGLALLRPGAQSTRLVIAFAQMIWSALLIHLSGGRIETHFHVFGSLAFLAFYRDWKVLLTATVVVAVDHMVRGLIWPQSVFGVFVESPWRWVEHAGWVVFEDIFLFMSCARGIRETSEISERQAQLEFTNAEIEQKVDERTSELWCANENLEMEMCERQQAEARETRLGRLIEESLNEVYIFDAQSLKFIEVNRGARENLGYSLEELQQMTPTDLRRQYSEPEFRELVQPLVDEELEILQFEATQHRKDGSSYSVDVHLQLSTQEEQPRFVAMVLDITERRKAEMERDAAQEQLIDASRHAGMAEVATGVLHNVGNVLNSVNVSINMLTERLNESRVSRLTDTVAMIKEHQSHLSEFLTTDERGRRVPDYLNRLSTALQGEQKSLKDEVGLMQKNIEHINQIVSTQQSFARLGGTLESIDLADLIRNALQILSAGLESSGIQVECDLSAVPTVETDRHKVMQILVNLLSNARNAIAECDDDDRRLTVRLGLDDDVTAHVDVIDTGIGISPENLDRIFNHGFTTREEGHGFGLHSCANAAAELGGTISVSSDGPGCGATFRLRLPVVRERSNNAEPTDCMASVAH